MLGRTSQTPSHSSAPGTRTRPRGAPARGRPARTQGGSGQRPPGSVCTARCARPPAPAATSDSPRGVCRRRPAPAAFALAPAASRYKGSLCAPRFTAPPASSSLQCHFCPRTPATVQLAMDPNCSCATGKWAWSGAGDARCPAPPKPWVPGYEQFLERPVHVSPRPAVVLTVGCGAGFVVGLGASNAGSGHPFTGWVSGAHSHLFFFLQVAPAPAPAPANAKTASAPPARRVSTGFSSAPYVPLPPPPCMPSAPRGI